MNLRRIRRHFASSPRHLVLRHGKRRLRRLEATSNDVPVGIAPGEEQLYSFYIPGLEAGLHQIEVDQDIVIDPLKTPIDPDRKKTVTSFHQFNVIAPRFVLPADAIYSVYPPQGHEDKAEVLPHVVLTDPTLPWERTASWNSEIKHPNDYDNNRVPWLAVLLFTQDELRLDPSVLSSIFSNTGLKDGAKQSTTMTINMLVSDVFKTKRTTTSIVYDAASDGDTAKTDAIFLQSKLFNSLFTKYDKDGNPDSTQTTGEVYPHRYLAHLRHIHMDGMAGAAASGDDDHTFSIVVCHRTGPLTISQPTTVIAHLVNIEGVEAMSFPITQDFVAMSSLYSWEYTCLPPNSLNVADAFAYLGENLNVLKPVLGSDELKKLNDGGPIGNRVARRVNDGYSLTRYRVQTGEITAAFMRSPFAATSINFPKETPWPLISTTGTKLQILDQELGIMDITYAAAWQLGKTLALADQAFAAALSRVRKQIFDIAMNNAQADAIRARATALQMLSPYKSRVEVVETIANTIKQLGSLPQKKLLQQNPNGMLYRWFREEPPALDLTYKGQEIDPIIDKYLQDAANKVASSSDGDGTQPYNEFNTPFSTDWMLVLEWVLNRLYLVDVPPYYLITDASHVPLESLRFFQIDPNWTSAMIDGGLSLANHLDQNDDRLRTAIKGAINLYLTTETPKLKYLPPIPSYGFFLRSALVTKFPDLVVDMKPPLGDSEAPIILRHEVVDQGTMLCLLRKAPVAPDFTSLILREPPHQQYFAAARTVDSQHIEMDYKRVYTKVGVDDPDRQHPIQYTINHGTPDPRGAIFLWGSSPTTFDVRTLNMENFASDLYTTIQRTLNTPAHPDWYTEPCPTAALVGLQLNEPCWQLEIAPPNPTALPGLGDDSIPRTLPMPPPRPTKPRAAPTFPRRQIACAPHPSFDDRKRSIPLKLNQPPPHFRIPRLDPTLTRPKLHDTPPSDAPVFAYAIYSMASPGQPIPMLPGKQDLIFSIVYKSGAQDFDMVSLEIHVPLGLPRPLMDNYSGAGATMLSNLRFNVIAQFNNQDELVLTLKPRSVTGMVPVARIQEMSFLLSGVIIHPFTDPTSVDIDVFEGYNNRNPFPKTFQVALVPVPAK